MERTRTEKQKNPLAWGALGFGISFAASIGFGASLGALADAAQSNNLDAPKRHLERSFDQIDEANRNVVRIQKQIGEACVSLVKVYLPGGQLAQTNEAIVVSDLVSEPGQPCGDTPREVRIAYRTSTINDERLEQARANRNTAEEENTEMEHIVHDSTVANGLAVGSMAGVGLGLIVGAITAANVDYNNKYAR